MNLILLLERIPSVRTASRLHCPGPSLDQRLSVHLPMSSSEVTASDADGDPPVKGFSSETEAHVCTHPPLGRE